MAKQSRPRKENNNDCIKKIDEKVDRLMFDVDRLTASVPYQAVGQQYVKNMMESHESKYSHYSLANVGIFLGGLFMMISSIVLMSIIESIDTPPIINIISTLHISLTFIAGIVLIVISFIYKDGE